MAKQSFTERIKIFIRDFGNDTDDGFAKFLELGKTTVFKWRSGTSFPDGFSCIVIADASPWLICDPWTKDGSEPTEIVLTLNGTVIVVPVTAINTNQVALRYDLAGKTQASNTVTAIARSMWGDSAPSAPFVFSAVKPSSPGGLKLSTN